MSVNLGTQLLEASTQRNQNEAVILEEADASKPLADGRGCLNTQLSGDPAGLIDQYQKVGLRDNTGVR